MEEKYQSEWSRELPMKEQLTIVQRLFVLPNRFDACFTQLFSLHLAYQLSIFFCLESFKFYG